MAIVPYTPTLWVSSPLKLHIMQPASEGLEPRDDRCIGSPGGEGRLSALVEGASPFEGLTFGLEVDGRVPIGRFDARMTEPVADSDQVDTGAQKINSRAMANQMRVHAFGCQTR